LRKKLVFIPQNIPQAKQDDYNQQLLSNLQSRLVELELEEKNLSNKYTDDNRSLRKVRDEIRIVHDKLSLQENKTYLKSTFGVNPIYQNLQQDLIRYETEKKALSSKHEALVKQGTVLGEKLTYFNRIELQYNQLKQQAESDRRNYDLYLTRLEESRISDAMDTEKISNISVVEPASIPLRPVNPKPFLNISMAIVFGLLGGLSWAFFCEYLRDRIESTEDAENLLGLPVLASIPLAKRAR
jgi:LPS O-antigen subunit length determinant protein (WzzB/FepE family)